jgi:TRAP-type C4-dicarboxylate transport system substrate-binding protein
MRIERRRFLALAGAAVAAPAVIRPERAYGAEVTLKFHHFLPPQATAQKRLIEPWAKAVSEQSQGRIRVDIFPAMQLGGRAPQLFDQVRDGVADVIWTLPSYTPGRFPKLSTFELPFMITDGVSTSKAVQAFHEAHASDEFREVRPLFFFVHARGVIHMRDKAVRGVSDLAGMKMRTPTRGMGEMLKAMGAAPVSLPAPQVPEALSRGVIDGLIIPYEVVPALKINELTRHHTETPGTRGLYTSIFTVAMNTARYEAMPIDLKKVIDDNSGAKWAEIGGRAFQDAEATGKEACIRAGGEIHVMPDAEMAKLRELAGPITAAFEKELGAEGAKLIAAANAILDKMTPGA